MITNGSWCPASLQGTSGQAAAPMRGRREFLAGLAALGAGALLTDRSLSGQAANPRRIDVHQQLEYPTDTSRALRHGRIGQSGQYAGSENDRSGISNRVRDGHAVFRRCDDCSRVTRVRLHR